MKLTQIKALLAKELSPATFKKFIKDEVEKYEAQLNKKGSSAPVYLEEDISYPISEEEIQFLFKISNTQSLDEFEVSYIADALSLSQRVSFPSEEARDSLSYIIIEHGD